MCMNKIGVVNKIAAATTGSERVNKIVPGEKIGANMNKIGINMNKIGVNMNK